mmetsp:Transcript_8084/g.25373  ORF Transcript_8084/g.25373 Transcript_8084/m.25373 type:complete len:241 (-) Transcript_8084:81-803(-)
MILCSLGQVPTRLQRLRVRPVHEHQLTTGSRHLRAVAGVTRQGQVPLVERDRRWKVANRLVRAAQVVVGAHLATHVSRESRDLVALLEEVHSRLAVPSLHKVLRQGKVRVVYNGGVPNAPRSLRACQLVPQEAHILRRYIDLCNRSVCGWVWVGVWPVREVEEVDEALNEAGHEDVNTHGLLAGALCHASGRQRGVRLREVVTLCAEPRLRQRSLHLGRIRCGFGFTPTSSRFELGRRKR